MSSPAPAPEGHSPAMAAIKAVDTRSAGLNMRVPLDGPAMCGAALG